jgi:hypothetical protein
MWIGDTIMKSNAVGQSWKLGYTVWIPMWQVSSLYGSQIQKWLLIPFNFDPWFLILITIANWIIQQSSHIIKIAQMAEVKCGKDLTALILRQFVIPSTELWYIPQESFKTYKGR